MAALAAPPEPLVEPSRDTALILRVNLPNGLERLRRQALLPADRGLPAHVTLLYPFVPVEAIDVALRRRIDAALVPHRGFSFRLSGPGSWPGTLYVAVDSEEPFRAIQADLALAFPEYPIFGGEFDFVPHVTVAVSAPRQLDLNGLRSDQSWVALPASRMATGVELIVRDASGWRVRWRLALRAS
jgi:2'-5' RNA ligase